MRTSDPGRPKQDVENRPSREIARPSDFDRGWFSERVVASLPPPSIRPPLPPIGRAASALLYGAIAGGLGGFLALLAIQSVLAVRHVKFDLLRALASLVSRTGIRLGDPRIAGVACVIVFGALFGAVLGRMTRGSLRIVPRLLFFALFLPILCLFVRTLLLRTLAPGIAAELPFGPLVLGSIVYGACIAIVLPAELRT